jgi:hypothetical protein
VSAFSTQFLKIKKHEKTRFSPQKMHREWPKNLDKNPPKNAPHSTPKIVKKKSPKNRNFRPKSRFFSPEILALFDLLTKTFQTLKTGALSAEIENQKTSNFHTFFRKLKNQKNHQKCHFVHEVRNLVIAVNEIFRI